MKSLKVREMTENYKKIQLYSVDDFTVEQSIVIDLKQDLLEFREHLPNQLEQLQLLAKLISYLEFGLSYEKYNSLFTKVLEICHETKKSVYSMVDKDAQYVKASKANLQKLIIWKSEQPNKYCKKGTVIADIFTAVKLHICGIYVYKTDRSSYCLEINEDLVVLKNLKKDILYYLI